MKSKIIHLGIVLWIISIIGISQAKSVMVRDLTGDGKQEKITEVENTGSGGTWYLTTIYSEGREILSISDGSDYKIIGNQIFTWVSDYNYPGDKYSPSPYLLKWYTYDKTRREFTIAKMGRTVKKYRFKKQVDAEVTDLMQAKSNLVNVVYQSIDVSAAINMIYRNAAGKTESQRDKYTLTEIGKIYARERCKREAGYGKLAYPEQLREFSYLKGPFTYFVYSVTIYKGWAQVGYGGGPVESGADVYQKNSSGRWLLFASGNEFSGWIEKGKIPKDIAKKIKID